MKSLLNKEYPFYPDSPLGLCDGEKDIFNRKRFVQTILKAINGKWRNTLESVVIGLQGKWGIGKTSILQEIRAELEEKEDFIVVEFEPWFFSPSKDLTRQFYTAISKSLKIKQEKTLSNLIKELGEEYLSIKTFSVLTFLLENFKNVTLALIAFGIGLGNSKEFANQNIISAGWKIFWPLLLILFIFILSKFLISWVLQLINNNVEKRSIQTIKEKVGEELKKKRKELIIILDDIDRLDRDSALQVFKILKQNGNIPNVNYLLAYDEVHLKNILTEENDIDEYLKKIVQIKVDIPYYKDDIVQRYLTERVDSLIFDKSNVEIDNLYWDDKYWYDIWFLLKHHFRTVRDAKIFLNSLSFDLENLQDRIYSVNIVDYLAIEIIRVFQPNLYVKIYENKNDLLDFTSDQRSGQNLAKRLTKEFELEGNEDRKKLLSRLFPISFKHLNNSIPSAWELEELDKEYKVSSKDHFDKYFESFENDYSLAKLKSMLQSNNFKIKKTVSAKDLISAILKNIDKLIKFKEIEWEKVLKVILPVIETTPKSGLFDPDAFHYAEYVIDAISKAIWKKETPKKLKALITENTIGILTWVVGRQSEHLDKKGLKEFGLKSEDYQLAIKSILKSIPNNLEPLLNIEYLYLIKEQWKKWGKNIDKDLYKTINMSIQNKVKYLTISRGTSSSSTVDSYYTEFRYSWDLKDIKKVYKNVSKFTTELEYERDNESKLYKTNSKMVDDFIEGKWYKKEDIFKKGKLI